MNTAKDFVFCAAWALNNTQTTSLYSDADSGLLRDVAKHVGKEFVLLSAVSKETIIAALEQILVETDGSAFSKSAIKAALKFYQA